MRYSKVLLALGATLLALGASSLFGGATPARGQLAQGDICGPIVETLVIVRNSRLVCDVECLNVARVSPCIQFGRSNIKLSLNGFTLTGPVNPPNITDCAPLPGPPGGFPPADGINVTNPLPGSSPPVRVEDVVIEGPGVVQRMRRHGIALQGTLPLGIPANKVVVKKLVSHQNCYSGVFMGGTNNSLLEEVVSVKNSAASRFLPCGGTCITNSNFNRIRRSEFAGNGSSVPGPLAGLCDVPVPNDFGVGLVGTSSGNIIEENGLGGNINGVFICPNAQGNLIQKNVIAGNPPIQVSASPGVDPAPDPVGADVRDFSPAGANTFKENLCITYTGPTPSACLRPAVGSAGLVPNLPQFAGHQNN
jgi:Right handed beta helix region